MSKIQMYECDQCGQIVKDGCSDSKSWIFTDDVTVRSNKWITKELAYKSFCSKDCFYKAFKHMIDIALGRCPTDDH